MQPSRRFDRRHHHSPVAHKGLCSLSRGIQALLQRQFVDTRHIGRELGVGYILEGSIGRSGELFAM